MAIRIGSNISSIQAQRRLSETSSALSKTYERLSSGQRINRASDDAAGLSVASALNAAKRVYSQGVRNLNDGISLLQIADSAAGNLSTIVTRVRELAEQSANGTFSDKQRSAIDKEAKELDKEFLRISKEVSFNGMHLFDGSLSGGLRVQGGYGVEGSIQSTLGKGLGTGSFSAAAPNAAEAGSGSGLSFDVATGDVNGDGILDVVTAGYSDDGTYTRGQASIFLGRGDGTFASRVTYATNTGIGAGQSFAVTLGDVNGDGILDLVTAGSADNQGEVSIRLGRGDGSFGSKAAYATDTGGGGGQSYAVALGDLNADGILDLVTAGGANGAQASVLLGRGDGTFGAKVTYATGIGGESRDVALGDVNGDGILDLVTAGVIDNQGQAGILLGRGDGTFASRVTYATETGGAFSGSYSVTLGDVNGDGHLDVVTAGVASYEGRTTILLGRGDGTFGAGGAYSTETSGGVSYDVSLGDVNGDGIEDLVTAGYATQGIASQGQASVFLGQGDGTFGSKAVYATDTGSSFGWSFAVNLGDANGDGILDLVTAGAVHNGTVQGQASVLTAIARDGISPLLPFSLSTKADALQAMAPLDRKLSQLAAQRGVIGAFQSRLGAAIEILQSTTENYAAAESRIKDTDIAEDAADLTRLQICRQVATAVLAQANQQPALAVVLLRNG